MDYRTLRALDLNLLLLFDALMATGHLTKAAKRLGVTQSAASQALGRLRQSLADELFQRTRKGMLPTPRALALAPQVHDALRVLQTALDDATHFDPATSRRTFRIAFGAASELTQLPALSQRVASLAPRIQLKCVAGSAAQGPLALREEEVDYLLDYSPLDDAHIRKELLIKEDVVAIARRGHPRLRGSLTSARFFAERHVVLSVSGPQRAQIERVVRDAERSRDVAAEVVHYASVPALVAASDLIALVPRSIAESPSFHSSLQVLRPPLHLPPLPLYLMWPHHAHADPGHCWLRDQIQTSVRSQATQ